MEMQQIRHLLAAADSANYAQAAKTCFTSRQNVAHSIKALESELGIALFERKGNNMLLTKAGRQFADEAKRVVMEFDSLRVMFDMSDDANETLRLALGVNLFAGMPEAADAYISLHHAQLEIDEFSCERCYEAVCSDEADAAIVMCMERAFPQCDSMVLGTSTAYAVLGTSSEYAGHKSITVSDLCQHRILLMSEPPFQYEPLFDRLDSLGYNRERVSVIASTSSMIHIVKMHTDTASLVSAVFAQRAPWRTTALPIADKQLDWRFYALFKHISPKFHSIARFIRGMREAFSTVSC